MAGEARESFSEWLPFRLSRRRFLRLAGLGIHSFAVGGVATGSAISLQPRLTYEPTNTFTIGRPQEYQVGEMRAFVGSVPSWSKPSQSSLLEITRGEERWCNR